MVVSVLKNECPQVRFLIRLVAVPLALIGHQINVHVVHAVLSFDFGTMVCRHHLTAASAIMEDVARRAHSVHDTLSQNRLDCIGLRIAVSVKTLPRVGFLIVHTGVHISVNKPLCLRRCDIPVSFPVKFKFRVLSYASLCGERKSHLRLVGTPFRSVIVKPCGHVTANSCAVHVLVYPVRSSAPTEIFPFPVARLDAHATIFGPRCLVVTLV